MKKIVYSLDYLRVIACIMVIGIHNMHLVSENVQDVRYIAINHFVKLGLPLFFVLSSIALENSVEYINDLKKYYSKKVLSLGIYFLFFLFFITNIQTINYPPYRLRLKVSRAGF